MTELFIGMIRVSFDTVQASVGEKQGEVWLGSGARNVEGSFGQSQRGRAMEERTGNRLEGNQWDWDVHGKGIGGVWSIFFICSYLICYFFGAPKISMAEMLLVAAGRAAKVKQMVSSIS